MSVYFVASKAGVIKIGWSANAEKRVQSLQTTTHEPLEVLLIVEGDRSHERHAHRVLGVHRVRGEWFEDCTDVRQYIERVRTGDWVGYTPPKKTEPGEHEQTCIWAADIIRKCAAFADIHNAYECHSPNAPDYTKQFWGVSNKTLHKFSYRDKEARVSEYMDLLRAVEVAANHIRSMLDDATDHARAILDGHAANLERSRHLGQEVKKLEDELKGLSGSPVVAKAEAVLAHTEEA